MGGVSTAPAGHTSTTNQPQNNRAITANCSKASRSIAAGPNARTGVEEARPREGGSPSCYRLSPLGEAWFSRYTAEVTLAEVTPR